MPELPELPELPASVDVPPELDDPDDDDEEVDDVDPPDELVFAVSDPLDDDVDGGGLVCDFCDVGSDDGDDDSLEQANAKIAIAAGHRNTYVFMRRTLGR